MDRLDPLTEELLDEQERATEPPAVQHDEKGRPLERLEWVPGYWRRVPILYRREG